jgi:hypothetical protein
VARYLRLKLRQNNFFITDAGERFGPGTEFVMPFAEAAEFLKEKGRRHVEILDDFESDGPPEEIVSIERPAQEPG